MPDISRETIRQASQGDRAAFEEIYRHASIFVYNVALRMLGSAHDAEEVSQDVFLTAYHKLGGYRYEASLKTWLYRITVNRAINFLKKRNRERNRTVPYEEAPDMSQAQSGTDNTRDEILKDRQEALVEKMLSALNPDMRSCIILRNLEGLSYQEIADSLKININTVRSRLKRAREKLMALRREVTNEL